MAQLNQLDELKYLLELLFVVNYRPSLDDRYYSKCDPNEKTTLAYLDQKIRSLILSFNFEKMDIYKMICEMREYYDSQKILYLFHIFKLDINDFLENNLITLSSWKRLKIMNFFIFDLLTNRYRDSIDKKTIERLIDDIDKYIIGMSNPIMFHDPCYMTCASEATFKHFMCFRTDGNSMKALKKKLQDLL